MIKVKGYTILRLKHERKACRIFKRHWHLTFGYAIWHIDAPMRDFHDSLR